MASVRWIPVVFGSLAVATTAHAQQPHSFAEVHMGMRVRIVSYAPEPVAREATRAAFRTIAELENIFSDYRDGSELRRLEHTAGEWTTVSEPLFHVVALALDVAHATGGAFDPTIAPLSKLWRDARRTGSPPSARAVRAARAHVGYRNVQLDSVRRAIRMTPGTRLDLGGIAKGYILQQSLRRMQEHGVRAALIEAGGDIVVGEAPPDRSGWSIDVPGADSAFRNLTATLTNAAIATSGSTAQYLEHDHVRYSHILDPRTGEPVTKTRLAYVLSRDAALADAIATALTVLGPSPIAALVRRYPALRAAFVR